MSIGWGLQGLSRLPFALSDLRTQTRQHRALLSAPPSLMPQPKPLTTVQRNALCSGAAKSPIHRRGCT